MERDIPQRRRCSVNETAFPQIEHGEFCLTSRNLAADVDFFRERLGFRLELIFPADEPSTAVLTGHGVRLRLEAGAGEGSGLLRLTYTALLADTGQLPHESPGGTSLQWAPAPRELTIPPVTPEVVWSDADQDDTWSQGRAGMHYRDLLPTRLGGAFIASHIRIPDGGEVPDYVHYHNVYFQMIYCYRGWVRVVYEDQGPPFVMRPGDCVLQPLFQRYSRCPADR